MELNTQSHDLGAVPHRHDEAVIQEVEGFFSPKRGGIVADVLARAFVGSLTVETLAVIDPAHKRISASRLVTDLTSENAHPESVKAFTVASYETYLGYAKAIVESPLWNSNPPENLARLRDYVSECLDRLGRDLKVAVSSKRHNISVPGLTQDEIAKLKPLSGVPAIECAADVQAFEFVLVGSNMGARMQANRQFEQFNLGGDLNAGAEFLNLYNSMWGAASAMARTFRETKQFSSKAEECERLKFTAAKLMEFLAAAFTEKSASADWLPAN